MKTKDIIHSIDHISTPTIIDALRPPAECPSWPDTRTYEDIIRLHAINTQEDVINERSGVFDFSETLSDSATVIDIGAGKGALITNLNQMAEKKGVKYNLVAVSATALDAEHAKRADYIYYQFVPDNEDLLRDYANKADLVIDTFGAATYAKNPIHALIYSLLLLKPGATYTAISSLVPGYGDYSAFGDENTQAELIKFLRQHLELEVTIKPTYLRSKVKGNENSIVKDLLIRCERPIHCKQKYHLTRFEEISKEVDKLIGTPEIVSVWSDANFGKFQIRRIKYTQSYEQSDSLKPSIIAPKEEANSVKLPIDSSSIQREDAEKITPIRFLLKPSDKKDRSQTEDQSFYI